jgi:hypothetical protein
MQPRGSRRGWVKTVSGFRFPVFGKNPNCTCPFGLLVIPRNQKNCLNLFLVSLIFDLAALRSSWWHRHLAGAANRLEACATKGGGHGGPPHYPFLVLRVSQRLMRD